MHAILNGVDIYYEVMGEGPPLVAVHAWQLSAEDSRLIPYIDLDMVRAAVQYKLNGEPGLKSVNDLYGQGPFAFERFVFEGVDRGFQFKSAYDGRGYPETLIFVEKVGPPFQVIGKNAGQAPRK